MNIIVQRRRRASHVIGDGADDDGLLPVLQQYLCRCRRRSGVESRRKSPVIIAAGSSVESGAQVDSSSPEIRESPRDHRDPRNDVRVGVELRMIFFFFPPNIWNINRKENNVDRKQVFAAGDVTKMRVEDFHGEARGGALIVDGAGYVDP